jgi:hypothetical protein
VDSYIDPVTRGINLVSQLEPKGNKMGASNHLVVFQADSYLRLANRIIKVLPSPMIERRAVETEARPISEDEFEEFNDFFLVPWAIGAKNQILRQSIPISVCDYIATTLF